LHVGHPGLLLSIDNVLSPQVNLENSTQREKRAASKQKEMRTWRVEVEVNSICGDIKKDIMSLALDVKVILNLLARNMCIA
jgi:hypothetical protein